MWTIVVAAGSGQRFGGRKQYADLGGELVLDRSLRIATAVSAGCVVVLPSDADDDELAVRSAPDGRVRAVRGGASRAESVRAGLAAVPAAVDVICVHDAARPLASPALFRRVRDAVVAGADAAIPGIAVADTIKLVTAPLPSSVAETVPPSPSPSPSSGAPSALGASFESGESSAVAVPSVVGVVEVESTLPRERLVAVQTPQAFAAAALRSAHAGGGEATDDAALVERAGGRVVVVAGEAYNRKLTAPDDLDWARAWLAADRVRSGQVTRPEAAGFGEQHAPAANPPAASTPAASATAVVR